MPPRKYGHGKSTFQEKYLTDPALRSWVQKVPNDVHVAKCRYCPSTVISLSSMGRQALISHMKGQKHMRATLATSSPSVASFLHTSKSHGAEAVSNQPILNLSQDPSLAGPSTSGVHQTLFSEPATSAIDPINSLVTLRESGMKKYLLSDNVTRAEIIWAINCVMTHTSFKSAAAGVEIMKWMFPDSKIADKMEMHRTKIAYVLMFGIAPYFKNNLLNLIKQCSSFVIMFDESFNKVANKQQMDVNVRFWNVEKEETSTRYMTSAFLHSGKAIDLQKALIASMECLDVTNLLQVSMDGPNVNVRLLKDLKVFLSEQGNERKIVDFGSCGLHVVHNAFKAGITATGWTVVAFLRACYNYFKGSPARRGDFIRITNTDVFPKKFCAIRWIENVGVAETAIDILPKLKLYIDTTASTNKEKSTSFKIISDSLSDPLLGAKLAFFKTLASDAEPFLREFQTDWPYAPFLYNALTIMVQTVLKRFVKPEKVKVGVDLEKDENLVPFKKIDLGFCTKSEIRKSKAKEIDLAALHKEACRGLKAFVLKIESRSPLQFKVTKNLSSLDPKVAVKPEGEGRFDKLVEEFVNLNWISGSKADKVSHQYKDIVKTDHFQIATKNFKRSKVRLDHFWVSVIKTADNDHSDLREFLERTLILSHGNAQVERGFSINKECLVENLKETSLVGLRTIYDAVTTEGGLRNLQIPKSMILSVRNSSFKYKESLKEARLSKSDSKKMQDEMKRKRKLLQDLKNKKAKLMEETLMETEAIEKQIEDLSKQL